ncbi:MAG: carotenoid 1,2-hydratase [Chitinophagaceae bacterium]|nr:MAG: carotenoid 1,2-hydratase [Chitinophagaceae bacterium]
MLAEQTLAPLTDTGIFIKLPEDQYRHPGAPTEWWWHIGTLRTDDGRAFGFEVNAVGIATGKPQMIGVGIASITDVQSQQHYAALQYMPISEEWAEADTGKPWQAGLNSPVGYPDSVAIAMAGIEGSVSNLTLKCDFTNKTTGKTCSLSLRLEQQGPPLYVFGSGRSPKCGDGPLPVQQYNFYYSYTNLKATGTLTIDGETFGVRGTTWMDHEYGVFSQPDGKPVQWMLQDLQLQNGLHLSNYVIVKPGDKFTAGVPVDSHATMLVNGESKYVATRTTPLDPQVINGDMYFMQFRVDLLSEGRESVYFMVKTSCTDQVFVDPTGLNSGYEGNGSGRMLLDLDIPGGGKETIELSKGDSWIEQMLYTKLPPAMTF